MLAFVFRRFLGMVIVLYEVVRRDAGNFLCLLIWAGFWDPEQELPDKGKFHCGPPLPRRSQRCLTAPTLRPCDLCCKQFGGWVAGR